MRPTSTRDIDTLTIDKRAYDLGALTYGQRLWIESEVTRRCGMAITQEEIRETLKEGVLAVLDGERQTQAFAVVVALEDAIALYQRAEANVPPGAVNGNVPEEAKQAREALGAAVIAALKVQRVVSRRYDPLKELLAAEETRTGTYIELRVLLGVRDWRGLTLPCTRAGDRLTPAAMNAIPDGDLIRINNRVAELSELTDSDVGESVSPSGAPGTPTSDSMG